MSARLELRASVPVHEAGGAATPAERRRRALLGLARAMLGGPPLPTRPAILGPAVAAALLAAYVALLVAVDGPVAGLVRVPVFAAAILLSAPLAVAVVTTALAANVALVAVGERAGAGGLDVATMLIAAIVFRGIVAAAVSGRQRGLEVQRQLDARAAQLAVLQAASARLSRAGGVESIGRAVVEETRGIIDYHNARVYLVEPSGEVEPIAFEGRVGEYEQVDFSLLRCRLGQGFTGWVALHGRPLLIGDANADPRGASIPGTDDVDESVLVVPMTYDGTVTGVITLSKLGLDQFDEDDERLLMILADLAATALESARLLARSDALAGELRRLLDMSSQLSGSLDPRQVANLIAHHLALAMGMEECAISWWDRPMQRLVTLGYWPEIPETELQLFFELAGFPQTLRVLEQQATVVIDADDPAADPAEVALLTPEGNRTLVMLPLVAKGQSIGLVELLSKQAVEPDTERLELARTMANEAAIALENARLYEEARALADHDPLTGFYNHRYFHERFGEEMLRAQRSHQPLSVLMLDLDDFKLVNDTFGHLFGDQVLAWTAEVIRSTLRASDVPARYGGDEFAILLPDTSSEAAIRAGERIRDAFAAAAFDGGSRRSVAVGVGVGVATFPEDGRTARELIAAADAGLYRQKRARVRRPSPRVSGTRRSRAGAPARGVKAGDEGSEGERALSA